MAHIQELLAGRANELNYSELLTRYPWIIRRNMNCILSPDSDGLLCGLFMSKYFGWKVVGYYDGKVMLLKDGVSTHDDNCAFLDMEIYRPHVKSVGHHMVLWNRKTQPLDWQQKYAGCIQPNLLRRYDGKNEFRLKYPLATIHLLIGIVGHVQSIRIPQSAIAPLFFVDGTFNVLYSYPENVLNWLNYLGIQNQDSPLRDIFMHEHYTVYSQIVAMDDFFRLRDTLNVTGERGDKFVISTKNSEIKNAEVDGHETFRITDKAKEKVEGFIRILSEATGWDYVQDHWTFSGLRGYSFSKSSFEAEGWRINNRTFDALLALNPLSWAMTSGANIEFTLENPSHLP
ncbi:MAG: hypothetical protein RBU27_07625 [Bacteroidota bacterium]|jgi:hypothetical protein|nr:hypothetical protein [Bacteroidota bacterium]